MFSKNTKHQQYSAVIFMDFCHQRYIKMPLMYGVSDMYGVKLTKFLFQAHEEPNSDSEIVFPINFSNVYYSRIWLRFGTYQM